MSAFMISSACLGRILFTIDRDQGAKRAFGIVDDAGLQSLGRRLMQLNASGIAARYGNRPRIPKPLIVPLVPCGKVQGHKSLCCLLYQCHEGNVTRRKLYREVREYACELAQSIVFDLPESAFAVWD